MNNNSTCIWTSVLSNFTDTIIYLTYTALPAVFFILGIIGHSLALIAFIKQRKSDAAYVYQVSVTVIKTFAILSYGLWILCFIHLAGQTRSGQKGGPGWSWFKGNYILIWFTARITPLLQSVSITWSLLATTAMAADRVLGLWKPIFYKSINKKKHHTISYILCGSLALLTSLDIGWRSEQIALIDQYEIKATDFSKTILGGVTTQTRNIVRFVSEIVLIFCSVSIVFLYRAYLKRKKLIKNDFKANQKMIFILAIFHSLSTAVPTFLLCGHSTANYISATFGGCDGQLIAIIIDLLLQAINAIDFYLLFFTSSQFKNMIIKSIRPGQNVAVAPDVSEMRSIPRRIRENERVD